MNQMRKAFTEHPASVGESYVEHMGTAFGFGFCMVRSGFACLIHGIFPFLFKTTGKECIERLHNTMVVNRCKAENAHKIMPKMSAAETTLEAAE